MAHQRFVFQSDAETYEIQNIKSVQGLGLPPVKLTSKTYWRRDGLKVNDVGYDARIMTFEWDFDNKTFEEAATQRRSFMRFFADKGPRKLEYTRADGMTVYLYPVYLAAGSAPAMEEHANLPEAMQFIAENPYFKRNLVVTSVTLETPLLEWPDAGLEWTEQGFECSSASNTLQSANEGDINADTVIRFYGPAVTPFVENTTTGQRFEVDRTLGASDMLEVDSASGRVNIIDGAGVRHNAYNYMTEDSELIQLARGVNQIQFGSAGGGGYIEIGGVEYYASL
jgi:hypothetical protein